MVWESVYVCFRGVMYIFKFMPLGSLQKKEPIYPTMFSELRHYPRFRVRLDTTDPVPRFINRQWRGYADQQREALIRYTT